MSSSFAQQIIRISNEYTIYMTLVLLIGGIIGNCLNLLIFSTSKIFRESPCAFLLIVLSLTDIGQVVITLSSRILSSALGVDPTTASLVWCRLRGFLAQILSLTSVYTICFIAFDQFLSTSYLFYLRNLSNLKVAHRFILIMICLSTIHSFPLLIIPENHPTKGCNIYNSAYFFYNTYIYFIGLIGILPTLISSLFSFLSCYNIRHIIPRQIGLARRRLDRQLTIIAFVRTICSIVLVLPYIVYRIYYYINASSGNSAMQIAILSLVGAIANSLIIFNYAGSFYLFLIFSARFRRQLKLLFKRIYSKIFARRNQIQPHVIIVRSIGTDIHQKIRHSM